LIVGGHSEKNMRIIFSGWRGTGPPFYVIFLRRKAVEKKLRVKYDETQICQIRFWIWQIGSQNTDVRFASRSGGRKKPTSCLAGANF
jgi:hypothetical protein